MYLLFPPFRTNLLLFKLNITKYDSINHSFSIALINLSHEQVPILNFFLYGFSSFIVNGRMEGFSKYTVHIIYNNTYYLFSLQKTEFL